MAWPLVPVPSFDVASLTARSCRAFDPPTDSKHHYWLRLHVDKDVLPKPLIEICAVYGYTPNMVPELSVGGGPLSPGFRDMPELSNHEKTAIRCYIGRLQAGLSASVESLIQDCEADSIWAGSRSYTYLIGRLARLRDQATDLAVRECLDAKRQWMEDAWAQRSACDDCFLRTQEEFEGSTYDDCRDLTFWQGGSSAGEGSAEADTPVSSPHPPAAEALPQEQPAADVQQPEQPIEPATPPARKHVPLAVDMTGEDADEMGVTPVRILCTCCAADNPQGTRLESRLTCVHVQVLNPKDDLAEVQMAEKLVDFYVHDPSGQSEIVKLAPRDLASLVPGGRLQDNLVDILVNMAASLLRARTSATVRVLRAVVMCSWLDWSYLTPGEVIPRSGGRRAAAEAPDSLLKFKLKGADYLFLPWCHDNHYSTVILCHPGARPRSIDKHDYTVVSNTMPL